MAKGIKFFVITLVVLAIGIFSYVGYRGYKGKTCQEDLMNVVKLNHKIFDLGEIIAIEAANSSALKPDDPRIEKLRKLKDTLIEINKIEDKTKLSADQVIQHYDNIANYKKLGISLIKTPGFERKRPETAHLKSVAFEDLKKQWAYEFDDLDKKLSESKRPFVCR